jgi:GH25 family lysozyme M1 (1,4-beta-N-acetylmuramidase)
VRTFVVRALFSGLALTVLSVAVVDGTSALSPAGYGRTVSSALTSHRQPVNHFNVGAAHSPEVLRQLAGPSGRPGKSVGRQHRADPKRHRKPNGRGGRKNSVALESSAALKLSAAPKAPASPGQGALQGVDVASYQHPNGEAINWQSVAKSGIQFAAVKTTEGTYYRNPFALTDLAQAKAAGLSVVAYTFAVPNGNGGSASAVAQADYLISYLASAGGPLPPIMLDIEYNPYGAECYGLTQSAMVSWIAQFSAEIQAKTGQEPIIYGPGSWWHDCTGGTSRFAQFPLWVPYYTSAPSPAITPGWSNYGFWQYSSGGTVNGINAPGNTDLDRLNPAALPLLDPGPQVSAAGGAVNLQLQLADRVAGQTVSFSAAGLPPGVSMSATGWITGWPAGVGSYQPTVSVTDGKGHGGSVSFPWTVNAAPTAGATGPVQLDIAGECLTVGGSANASQAQIAPCSASSAQAWTYASDGTLRIDNKCLTIPAAAQGAQVGLQPCASAAAQQWRLAYPKALNPALVGHPTTLVNPWSGMCLADPGFSTTSGTQVQLWPCDGYADQSWTLPAGPVTAQIPGMCVADSGNQTADGTKIVIAKCGGTSGQAWLAEPDGTLRINGKCLDVQAAATASGSPVDLRSCNGSSAQRWNLVSDGTGITLVNQGSGLCLADPRDATTDGTQLVISGCVAADPGMSWRLS